MGWRVVFLYKLVAMRDRVGIHLDYTLADVNVDGTFAPSILTALRAFSAAIKVDDPVAVVRRIAENREYLGVLGVFFKAKANGDDWLASEEPCLYQAYANDRGRADVSKVVNLLPDLLSDGLVRTTDVRVTYNKLLAVFKNATGESDGLLYSDILLGALTIPLDTTYQLQVNLLSRDLKDGSGELLDTAFNLEGAFSRNLEILKTSTDSVEIRESLQEMFVKFAGYARYPSDGVKATALVKAFSGFLSSMHTTKPEVYSVSFVKSVVSEFQRLAIQDIRFAAELVRDAEYIRVFGDGADRPAPDSGSSPVASAVVNPTAPVAAQVAQPPAQTVTQPPSPPQIINPPAAGDKTVNIFPPGKGGYLYGGGIVKSGYGSSVRRPGYRWRNGSSAVRNRVRVNPLKNPTFYGKAGVATAAGVGLCLLAVTASQPWLWPVGLAIGVFGLLYSYFSSSYRDVNVPMMSVSARAA